MHTTLPLVALLRSGATAVTASGLQMPALTGAVGQLAGQTRGIALSFFLFVFVLAIVLEAFGPQSPTQSRDYAGVLWRAILVLFLLSFYSQIFSPLLSGAQALADSIAPPDSWSQLSSEARKAFDDHWSAGSTTPQAPEAGGNAASLADRALQFAGRLGTAGVDVAFSGLLMVAILICQAIHWVMATLATILQGLLFILGPLAIAASVPRASGIGGRWFTNLLTIAAWPIVSGLLAKITLAIGLKSFVATGAFGSLAAAVLMAALALATPMIASAIVGGSIRDLVTPAVQTLAHGTTLLGQAYATARQLPAAGASVVQVGAAAASYAAHGVAGLASGAAQPFQAAPLPAASPGALTEAAINPAPAAPASSMPALPTSPPSK